MLSSEELAILCRSWYYDEVVASSGRYFAHPQLCYALLNVGKTENSAREKNTRLRQQVCNETRPQSSSAWAFTSQI
jgi:hypothetical protein